MNHKNSLIKLLGTVLLIETVAVSCYDYDKVPIVELAALENEITMGATGGTFEITFYTNSSYHIEYLKEVDWLTLSASEPVDAMAVLTGECARNDGFKRRADFVLCSDLDTRRDTITVKQEADIDTFIGFDDVAVLLPGAGGSTTGTVRTNVPFEEMTVDITYPDASVTGWVTDFYIVDEDSDERTMHITFDPNPDEEAPRSAVVYLSFTDGWGERIVSWVNLMQYNANEELGRMITFEELRGTYATGRPINDYICVTGIVVSNRESANAGQAQMTSKNTIDRTPETTTVYLESEDAKYGLVIHLDDEEYNAFNMYDKVSLALYGATLTKTDNRGPVRYELTGFSPSMIYSRDSQTSAPLKERTIGTLTDDDMYTYVTLKDVQFPVRKGGMYPVNARFGQDGGNSTYSTRGTMWPLLVIDKEGNDLYMLTNDSCPYKRIGRRLPYGSGSISGVVVHEHYSCFNWANGLGNIGDLAAEEIAESNGYIGDFQIRHQSEGDVYDNITDDFEDGFSKFICEYRYVVLDDDGYGVPSYGSNGHLDYTGHSSSDATRFNGAIGYDYLGPCGHGSSSFYGINIGNKNGLGIIIDETNERTDYKATRFAYNHGGYDGTETSRLELACQYATDEYCGYGSTGWTSAAETSLTDEPNNCSESGETGYGYVNASAYVDYCSGASRFWSYSSNKPYAFVVNFSTKDISASVVTMQVTMRGTSISGGTPRYWIAEWSLTNDSDDSAWTSIGEFTVPDASAPGHPLVWQSHGYKGMNFKLPTTILGQDNVYVRLRPTSDASCRPADDEPDYSNNILDVARCPVGIGYLAVRYN